MSKGEDQLYEILKKEFPNYTITRQMPIKIGRITLFVDLAIKELNLAFEYHGIQHLAFNKFFHKEKSAFKASQYRDSIKELRLRELGYTLITFFHSEDLTSEIVISRIISQCQKN